MTESKGFGPVQVAGKWKRCYDGFAADEPWFILTNLDSLDAAISAYQRRFSIEEMFRDLKLGGYGFEQTRVEGKRFMTIVLLIALSTPVQPPKASDSNRRHCKNISQDPKPKAELTSGIVLSILD